jgi:alpha-galactosidase
MHCTRSARRMVAVLILIAFLPAAAQKTETIAATPPMGWNSWNHFNKNVDDPTIRAQADAMVSSGMRDAGYVYVNIDDTWEGERDASGVLHSNSKFPDMKALADYVHSKGLKIGIYSTPGPKTCAGFEGSYGHEEQDAQTWADWGIDYLKYDLCGLRDMMKAAPSPDVAHKLMVDSYIKMRDALRKTGRPIVYSLCQYGNDAVWEWGPQVGGNLWRTTGDIQDRWQGKQKWPGGDCCSNGVLDIVDEEAGLDSYAGPGHWNDPDMLEVGNGGMSDTEYRSHFSLWAILAAPLMAGNDISTMRAEIRDILTNKEVIAVDQDPLGSQGRRVWKNGDLEVWSKQMKDGSRTALLLNRSTAEQEATARWEDLGFPAHLSASVRDLWQHKDLGKFQNQFSSRVPSHGVVMITVKP